MSNPYKLHDRCLPSKDGTATYIYSITPTVQNGIAAITSAGELLLLDRQNLSNSPVLRLKDVPGNVSCLVPGDDAGRTTMCCGSDGMVVIHDVRSQAKISHFKLDRALTALNRMGHAIAVGTELSNHQAVVSVWDQRQNKQIWQNAENHDDITALDFHPTKNHMLLAGGDDGQVGIFDISVAEEDDSIVQGLNHGPIHKAGFLGDDRFFALSSDQNLSIHPISSAGDEEDPQPTLIGDLRPLIPCEYVIDVFHTGTGFAVATGTNINDQIVKVVEIKHACDSSKKPKLEAHSGFTLEGAHGEEIVRDLFVDDATGTVFTAGEDGAIQAFRASTVDTNSTTPPKPNKTKKYSEPNRYKPY